MSGHVINKKSVKPKKLLMSNIPCNVWKLPSKMPLKELYLIIGCMLFNIIWDYWCLGWNRQINLHQRKEHHGIFCWCLWNCFLSYKERKLTPSFVKLVSRKCIIELTWIFLLVPLKSRDLVDNMCSWSTACLSTRKSVNF